MKKKLGNFDSFFDGGEQEQEQPEKSSGTQQKEEQPLTGSAKGLKPGLTRYTMIVEASQLETLKALAYYDRLSMKEACNEMLANYIAAAGAAKVKKALTEYNKKSK